MAITTTTSLVAYQTYADKAFIPIIQTKAIRRRFAQKRTVPINSGKAAQFTRFLRIAPVDTVLAAEQTNPTAIAIADKIISVTVGILSQNFQVSQLASQTYYDNMKRQIDEIADSAAWSYDLNIAKVIGGQSATTLLDTHGVFAIRADNDVSNDFTILADSTTGSNVVFTYPTAYGTPVADQFNGAWITIYEGTGIYQTKKVLDTTVNSQEVTCTFADAWGVNPDTTSRLKICQPSPGGTSPAGTEMPNNTGLNTSAMRRANMWLTLNGARTFPAGDYAMVIDPYNYNDIMASATWEAAKTYSDVKDIYAGNFGTLYNITGFRTSAPLTYNRSVTGTATGTTRNIINAGAYRSAGAFDMIWVMGADSYGVVGLSGVKSDVGDAGFDTEFHITDGASKLDPANLYIAMAYKTTFAATPLTSTNCLAILTRHDK